MTSENKAKRRLICTPCRRLENVKLARKGKAEKQEQEKERQRQIIEKEKFQNKWLKTKLI